MKALGLAMLLCAAATCAVAGDKPESRGQIVVRKLQGDVTVRHGVTEVWTTVASGDVLRPDDSMKTGKKGSAILLVNLATAGSPEIKTISLPPEVIVDMSDIRNLTQQELMLKLTMEKVRASSYRWRNDELQIPNASVVHGQDQASGAALGENDPAVGGFHLNGARVLFQNGFYSTCALRTMEVFRLYPQLGTRFENRLMMADALSRANIASEALTEYSELGRSTNLTPEQAALLRARIDGLRK
jgi:hypothetical protein